jgi:hypothetical protein
VAAITACMRPFITHAAKAFMRYPFAVDTQTPGSTATPDQ